MAPDDEDARAQAPSSPVSAGTANAALDVMPNSRSHTVRDSRDKIDLKAQADFQGKGRPETSNSEDEDEEDSDQEHWEPESHTMDSKVQTSVRRANNKQMEGVAKGKDRSDRATVETVLDPRTRMVLFKMLNKGVFSELHGCISTGKEANVYHAITGDGTDLAVKVYKTSILVFKDRDRYVSGDPRFKTYSKSNPRKMVKMWAEKELRNLARLHAAGISCPKPVQLRTHVLVMEFIGHQGVAALRLKDARMPTPRLQSMYTEMVVLIRKLYQVCRLVHGDLSEYNILVNEGKLFIIDVSQAVDLDHPRALDFLREDAAHVNAFFRRAGIATLTTRELFDFVVDPNINAGNIDAAIDSLSNMAASRDPQRIPEDESADNVFVQTHIPRALDEISDHEEDYERLAGGQDVEGIYYQTITGMRHDMSGAREGPAYAEDRSKANVRLQPVQDSSQRTEFDSQDLSSRQPGEEQDFQERDDDRNSSKSSSIGEGSSSEDEISSDEHEAGSRDKMTVEEKEALKEARKLHKKEVKEANRERRKTKMPKSVKKKLTSKNKKHR